MLVTESCIIQINDPLPPYGLKLEPCRAASKLRLFSSSAVALSEPLPRVREAVRGYCPEPGTRVSGFVHGGLPKLTSLGLVAAPVAAPVPAPTTAPTAIPGGPASAPTPAPVAAPAAAPPLVRSGWLVPQPAKKAMVARKATLYLIGDTPFGAEPMRERSIANMVSGFPAASWPLTLLKQPRLLLSSGEGLGHAMRTPRRALPRRVSAIIGS